MAKVWLPIILIFISICSYQIKGDTYHYRALRKICPNGSYHDPIRDKCRRLPGGGELIKLNLDAKCSKGFTGLLPYDKKSRYYYVCKSDAVLTCACKRGETFNRARLRCEGKNRKSSHESRERLADTVVDNILEKYKCTTRNDCFEDDECCMSNPQWSVPQSIDCKTQDITQLQNLLNYLKVLRMLTRSSEEVFRSQENPSTETFTSSRENPFLIAFRNFLKFPSFLLPKPNPTPGIIQSDPQRELQDWKKNWGIDEKPQILATSEFSRETENEEENEEFVQSALIPTEEPEVTKFTSFIRTTTKRPETTTYTTEVPKTISTTPLVLLTSTEKAELTSTNSYETTESSKMTSTIQSTEAFESTTDNLKMISTTSMPFTENYESTTKILTTPFDPLYNFTTTEKVDESTVFDSTIEPITPNPTTISDDENSLPTTTEFLDTTTLPSEPQVSHKLVMRITDRDHTKILHDIGEIDFIDEDHEYMYEYFYEDDPYNVLYTKDIHQEDLKKIKENGKDVDFIDEDVALQKDETTTLISTTSEISTTTESFTESSSIVPETTTQSKIQNSDDVTSTLSMTSTTENLFESTTESLELESSSILNYSESTTPLETESSTTDSPHHSDEDESLTSTTEVSTSTEAPLDLKLISTLETTTNDKIETSTISAPEELKMPTESSIPDFDEATETDYEEHMYEYFYEDEPEKVLFTKDIDNKAPKITTEKSFTESTTLAPQSTTESFTESTKFDTQSTTESSMESTSESFLNEFETSTVENNLKTSTNFPLTTESLTTTEISSEHNQSLESTTLNPIPQTSTTMPVTTTEISKTTKLHSESLETFEITTKLPKLETISPLSTSSPKPQNPLYWQDPTKKDEIEYYYVHEDYEVDENGKPIENEKNLSHDGKESIKQRRENSFEYYVESISASREQRILNSDIYSYIY